MNEVARDDYGGRRLKVIRPLAEAHVVGSDAVPILADLQREGLVVESEGTYRLSQEALRLLAHLDARCSQCGRHLLAQEPDALGWGPPPTR